MGWNDHMPDAGEFAAIAIEAGAISPCPLHDDIMLDQCDDEANRRAYAIATNRWKADELFGARENIMEGIKAAISDSAFDCPRCEKLGDE